MADEQTLPPKVVGYYYKNRQAHMASPTMRQIPFEITLADLGGFRPSPGDLIEIEFLPKARRMRFPHGKVTGILGDADNEDSISSVVLSNYDIPRIFPKEALALAEAADAAPLEGRVDLRPIPLITIDGEKARDFDDAVWAEADPDPANPGGWHLLVAIADVTWYVRDGDALDEEALKRGNSVYLPDKVVPMLPEALSNGWCSLKPQEDRGCLAVHLWVDHEGELLRWQFVRGLMRSVERMTYRQVQEIANSGAPHPLLSPLWGAYRALRRARDRRGALNLQSFELEIAFGSGKKVASIQPVHGIESEQLIEECMVLANTAAAKELAAKEMPLLYRRHPDPPSERMEIFRSALKAVNMGVDTRQGLTPHTFNRLLDKAKGTPFQRFVNQLVLQSQSQALYQPGLGGHFGLGLTHYAHFTSPIRRYADVVVHRGLISALNLGAGGWPEGTGPEALRSRLGSIGAHVSITERRAVSAERDATNRFVSRYYEDKLGEKVVGTIVRVSGAGVLVAFTDTGAEGFIPKSLLGHDLFRFVQETQTLVGERSRFCYSLGDTIEVEILRVDTLTGSIVLQSLGLLSSHRQSPSRAPVAKRSGNKQHWRQAKEQRERDKRTAGRKKKPS